MKLTGTRATLRGIDAMPDYYPRSPAYILENCPSGYRRAFNGAIIHISKVEEAKFWLARELAMLKFWRRT